VIEGGTWPLVSASEMRALDRHTIETLGVPGEILMESAGRAIAQAVIAERRNGRGGDVVVVCGRGNNGGDGFVVSRHLALGGVAVRTLMIGDRARLAGDAAANAARLERLGLEIEEIGEEGAPSHALRAAGVVVDALFGTGLTRPLGGLEARVVDQLSEWGGAGGCVVAVDLPSGIDSDSGQILGTAIRADVTVTLGLPKIGLALEPGRGLAGRIIVGRIGIADPSLPRDPEVGLWTPRMADDVFPERSRAGHKGSFGHVLVVAGSRGKTGAAALCAEAAGRAGAGLVTVGCPAGVHDILEVKCTEAMTAPLADSGEHALAPAAEDEILALAAERDVVALGPGIGRSAETVGLVRAVTKRIESPLVIDADGLFAFGDEPEALFGREAPTILTPHPGEAARLLGSSNADVNRDRSRAARELARRSGAIVVLKGAGTVIAEPAGRMLINPTGGPALGSGGTGDVLTGMVAALLAQGCESLRAAALAAYWHGAAADLLVSEIGAGAEPARGGMLAGDLPAALARAAADIHRRARAQRPDWGEDLAIRFPEPG